MTARRFLFLQGPLSPLYALLADRLAEAGCDVERVNFSIGDRLHWRLRPAVAYRGRLADWGAFVDGLMEKRRITDVVMHGERRPYHRIAAERARARGIRVVVTELGYLRPDWMTIELGGTSAGSHFPVDPDHIRRIAHRVPEFDARAHYRSHFSKVAIPDVTYNLLNTLLWFFYPHFQRHTIYFPPLEYTAWVGRLMTSARRDAEAMRATAGATQAGGKVFVHLMQLEGDFQIREYSPFAGQAEAIDAVISSFAAHAAPHARLLVKAHPLDNGLHRWGDVIAASASRNGVATRVAFLDGGGLDRLFTVAQGVVTVNSSAGLEAMMAGRPVKLLGPAIYDVAGLVYSGPLDGFWRSPQPPDASLLADFLRALAGTVQVRGTIYSDEGLAATVAGMAERLLTDSLNQPDAFVDSPPRLERLGPRQG